RRASSIVPFKELALIIRRIELDDDVILLDDGAVIRDPRDFENARRIARRRDRSRFRRLEVAVRGYPARELCWLDLERWDNVVRATSEETESREQRAEVEAAPDHDF